MNYIGSKHSLLDFLHQTISRVINKESMDKLVFADLFAGTGVVGSFFRSKGCKVIANDIQYYSYVLNKHYLQTTKKDKLDLIDYLNNLKPVNGFVYNNYCLGSGSERLYFTDENGRKCDAIRNEIEKQLKSKKIGKNEYFTYLAALIKGIDKVANTAAVYGAFLKKIKRSAAKELKLELLDFNDGIIGEVYNKDANELISTIKGDILYLDPPYNERQYCANYHVLETIALNDQPKLRGVTGLRDYNNQKSDYCTKKKVIDKFTDLLEKANFKYIFLSYNNEGLMTLDEIKEVMSKFGEYSLYKKEYRRFKADKDQNRNIKTDKTIEYLHCLVKSDLLKN
ncbi:DNA adenine methylase [Mycoplasma bradburyae]|uniref:DNA adenine methylase n=1 Tax=Mycoplasma bradburyae TaxID=2963128 RepID=UPI0023418183|nr:DNA adenine methylase [Mycoplasma bradburyae]MDC4184265.1 DNA adenine methylase [Mycoplasma bradburyae]